MEETETATRFAQLERSMRRRFRLVTGALLAVILVVNVAPVAADHLIVRSSDIVDGAVTTPKLRNGSVGTHKLKNGAVGTKKLKDRGVDTPDVRNGAIGTHKLKNGAVGPAKLMDGAITTDKISPDARGVALAGAQITGSGLVRNWFNRYGGQPVVSRATTGVYDVRFPGLEGELAPNAIVIATVAGNPAVISVQQVNTTSMRIVVYNLSGTTANRGFNLVVTAPRNAGATGSEPEVHHGLTD